MNEQEAIKEILSWTRMFMTDSECSFEAGEAQEMAIKALEKQIPKNVIKKPSKHMHMAESYYCECGKEQKNSFKNRREGCFCERCGQKLDWSE